MKLNPLHSIDFYKADHRRQYPEGTTLVYSNLTPRSSHLTNLPEEQDQIIFFGLQYFMLDYLVEAWSEGFFKRPKAVVVKEYKRRMDTSLGEGAISVDHIEALHDLGYLPLEIRAMPEGSPVNIKVPCLTIHNTHPEFFWLVNYVESVMSTYLWKPCVSATTANWYRKTFDDYAETTGGSHEFVPFQGHDFSFRGMSGIQDAALSGAAHLLSFVGTDTVPAIDFLEDYYGANADNELIGCSVPATEHSVMCMGTEEGEFETFKRLITEIYPTGIVSIVSDTWDLWTVLTDYLPRLKDEIMARDGKVVIRPDSGDPVKIVCGDIKISGRHTEDEDFDTIKDIYKPMLHPRGYVIGECNIFKYGNTLYEWGRDFDEDGLVCTPFGCHPENEGVLQLLWETFGGTVNEKGYKVLDEHIGLIYGDSITPTRAKEMLDAMKGKGYASTNIVLGVGSFTYNYVTRDTYGFAVKATYGEVKGEGRMIFKNPKTDNGLKKSAKGLLKVVDGKLVDELEGFHHHDCELETVFKDGQITRMETLAEIRKRMEMHRKPKEV